MAEGEKPVASPPVDTGEGRGKQASQPDRKYAGDFDSVEDLEKGYRELFSKLGTQGAELSKKQNDLEEARKYQLSVQPVVQLIDQDEDLRKKVLQKLGLTEEGEPVKATDSKGLEGTQQVQKMVRQEVEPLRQIQERQIFDEFEKKYGLNALDPEKRKEQRARIGAYIAKWSIGGIQAVPLNALSDRLEDAYILVNQDLIKAQGKAEGRVAERSLAAGAVGSIPSGEAKVSPTDLTPAQKRVARMANLTDEDYADALNKIESEDKSERS